MGLAQAAMVAADSGSLLPCFIPHAGQLTRSYSVLSLALELLLLTRCGMAPTTDNLGRGQPWTVQVGPLKDLALGHRLLKDVEADKWCIVAARLGEYLRYADMCRRAHPRAVDICAYVLQLASSLASHGVGVDELHDFKASLPDLPVLPRDVVARLGAFAAS
eukprot:20415-Alexandrium_andersonii.AAC.1